MRRGSNHSLKYGESAYFSEEMLKGFYLNGKSNDNNDNHPLLNEISIRKRERQGKERGEQ